MTFVYSVIDVSASAERRRDFWTAIFFGEDRRKEELREVERVLKSVIENMANAALRYDDGNDVETAFNNSASPWTLQLLDAKPTAETSDQISLEFHFHLRVAAMAGKEEEEEEGDQNDDSENIQGVSKGTRRVNENQSHDLTDALHSRRLRWSEARFQAAIVDVAKKDLIGELNVNSVTWRRNITTNDIAFADVDECRTNEERKNDDDDGDHVTALCPANSKCINTWGSYYCQCLPGFKEQEQLAGVVGTSSSFTPSSSSPHAFADISTFWASRSHLQCAEGDSLMSTLLLVLKVVSGCCLALAVVVFVVYCTKKHMLLKKMKVAQSQIRVSYADGQITGF